MNAYEAILEALIARGRTGEGAAISVSHVRRDGGLDDGAAAAARRRHAAASASGSRIRRSRPTACSRPRDGADILISIQNDREWRVLAEKVLGDAALAADPRLRHQRRARRSGAPKPTARSPRRSARSTSTTSADEARRGRHRLRPRQRPGRARRSIRICAASRSARRAGRSPIRRRRAARRRDAPLRPGAGARRAHREGARGISVARKHKRRTAEPAL